MLSTTKTQSDLNNREDTAVNQFIDAALEKQNIIPNSLDIWKMQKSNFSGLSCTTNPNIDYAFLEFEWTFKIQIPNRYEKLFWNMDETDYKNIESLIIRYINDMLRSDTTKGDVGEYDQVISNYQQAIQESTFGRLGQIKILNECEDSDILKNRVSKLTQELKILERSKDFDLKSIFDFYSGHTECGCPGGRKTQ